jgi:hypothetical protein
MGLSDQSDPSGKVKVIDRRWFTEDGSLRADRRAPESPGSPDPEPRAPREDDHGHQPREASARSTSPIFLELVTLLAQQAQMMVAGGAGAPGQPDQAMRLIEYLAILEAKTTGNLSMEESQTLSNLLLELRSLAAQSFGSPR